MRKATTDYQSQGGHSALRVYNSTEDFNLHGVALTATEYLGERCLCMAMPDSAIQDPEREQLADRDFMAWVPLDFANGIIEAWVASDLIANAPSYARGFIGLTFRINNAGAFESIYLRPTNSVSDDQIRRNHSVQYVAFPDFRFDRLRRESPERYESYAELELNRWIKMKIVVNALRAELYLDDKEQPALIVTDLKLGESLGGVGVWLESGTIAYFRDLKIFTNGN